MRVSSTEDVSLELHDLGGEGPTLLIAHATGFCAGAYRPLADRLGQRFHVWAVDFRGHGDATLPTGGDLTWRGMVDDVLAVVTALDDGPVFAVGHSMGGACLLAAERRVAGTLRAAYVFEPIVVPADFAAMTGRNPMAESARRRRPGFPTRLDALARYASRPPLGTFRADALAAYVEHGFGDAADGTVMLKCLPESEARTFEADAKPLISEMDTITVPVVVARGFRDRSPGPGAFAAAIAETLPHGTLVAYNHLSHFGPFQDPDTIAEDIIAAFLLA